MEFSFETIIFYALAIFISVFSVMTVCTRHIVRSATYLLFTLFATAGIYNRRHLFSAGIYLFRICANHGLCRRYCRSLRVLHSAH